MTDNRSAPCLSYFSVCVFHLCLHRSLLWTNLKDNCWIQKDFNCLCVNLSQNISAIIFSFQLRRSWHDGFPELVIIVRLRSTHTSGRKSSFCLFFLWRTWFSNVHERRRWTQRWPAVWHWSFHFVSGVYAKATNVVCYWFPSFKLGWISVWCCIVFTKSGVPNCFRLLPIRPLLFKWHCSACGYQ